MFDSESLARVTGWVGELARAPHTVDGHAARAGVVRRIRDWAEAALAQVTLDAADLEAATGATTAGAVAFLQDATGISAREARGVVRRAEVIASAPAVGAALAQGGLSAAHADALARTVGRAARNVRNDLLAQADTLVQQAGSMGVDDFARHCDTALRTLEGDGGLAAHERMRRASTFTQWTDRTTGMYCGRFQLDPVRGATVRHTIARELDALTRDQRNTNDRSCEALLDELAAQALVNLIEHGHTHIASGGRPNGADIHVIIDHHTLAHAPAGHHPNSTSICELSDGTPIPAATARRLACNAGIIPVVLGGDSEPLDVGRARRLATTAQRRAIRTMYRTCAAPGCDVTVDRCDIHHVQPFEHGGHTNLDNLVPVCWRHHHLVHEGGWQLRIDPQRTITMVKPDGTTHTQTTHPATTRCRPGPGVGNSGSVQQEVRHHAVELGCMLELSPVPALIE